MAAEKRRGAQSGHTLLLFKVEARRCLPCVLWSAKDPRHHSGVSVAGFSAGPILNLLGNLELVVRHWSAPSVLGLLVSISYIHVLWHALSYIILGALAFDKSHNIECISL
jgi:hypothetical protein